VKRNYTVQIGRVCLINRGEDAGKICTILDVVDQNRALIDGPTESTGVHRQTMSFKNLALTPIVVTISRAVRPSTLAKALKDQKVVEQWESSAWASKLKAQRIKKTLNDFDRFKNMVAHKKRTNEVNRQLAKLKKAGVPKKAVKKSVLKKAEIAAKEISDRKKAAEKARADELARIAREKAEKAEVDAKTKEKEAAADAAAKKKKS